MRIWHVAVAGLFAMFLQEQAVQAESVRTIAGAKGTLLALLPSQEGLVFAADSRETISGIYCDQRSKIVIPDKPDHTAIAITGESRWYDLKPLVSTGKPMSQEEFCQSLETAKRIFDMESVVREWVERQATLLRSMDIDSLAQHCLAELDRVRFVRSDFLADAEPHEIMNVVLASYEPETKVTAVRDFRLTLLADRSFSAGSFQTTQYSPEDVGPFKLFGAADKVQEYVLPTFGSQKLREGTRSLIQSPQKVQDTTLQQAEDFVTDIIEISATYPELNTETSGVGGLVRRVLIGDDPRPKRLN